MSSDEASIASGSDAGSLSAHAPVFRQGGAQQHEIPLSQPKPVTCDGVGAVDFPPSSISKSHIEQLFQCVLCEKMLNEAITLPCGKSICKNCTPETHDRSQVTYPGHADRRQGFDCPFSECGKQHSVGDCSVDVTLNKLLDQIVWPLMRSLTEIDSETTIADRSLFLRSLEGARPELDCLVCYGLYNDPVTTGCGHTFCRCCLYRAVDHSKHCPICRRDLTISPIMGIETCPSNEKLVNIIEQLWPKELSSRRQVALFEDSARHQEFNMSLFQCTLSFPHMPTFLHVFEPRYKLMIRRVLDGDRTFGMVFPNRWSRSTSDIPFYELGTLMRITNVEFYPDGRCLLETVGLSRFRVLRHSVCDEYDVGQTERIDDVSIETEEAIEVSEITEGGRAAAERLRVHRQMAADNESILSSESSQLPDIDLAEVEGMPTQDIMAFALDFVERMRNQGAPWMAHQSISIYGDCPTNPAVFPWWLASVLPVKMRQKYLLLTTTSVRARLKICSAWLKEWDKRTWYVHYSFYSCLLCVTVARPAIKTALCKAKAALENEC